VEDTAKLKAELLHLQDSSKSKSAEEMASGLESSVALCENILQKIQKSDDDREQLEKQLQSKAEEVTKLNEQLKLYEQPGECSYVCDRVSC
jgi:bacterioferritin (cytochrome b1)